MRRKHYEDHCLFAPTLCALYSGAVFSSIQSCVWTWNKYRAAMILVRGDTSQHSRIMALTWSKNFFKSHSGQQIEGVAKLWRDLLTRTVQRRRDTALLFSVKWTELRWSHARDYVLECRGSRKVKVEPLCKQDYCLGTEARHFSCGKSL